MALAMVFANDPELRDRLLVTRYEGFLADPARETRRVTDFLELSFDPAMVDVGRFRKADGSPWPSDWSVYQTSGDIWRSEMPRSMAELTEFVCDPDMRVFGYEPEVFDPQMGLSDDAFEYAVRNLRDCLGWRTDFAEVERTIGSELYRRRLLATPAAATDEEMERCFLFPEILHRLSAMNGRHDLSQADSV
jgi:hypothetical protein